MAKTVTAVSYPQASAYPGGHCGSTLPSSYSLHFGAEPSLFQSPTVGTSNYNMTQLASESRPGQSQAFSMGVSAQTVFGGQMMGQGTVFGDPFLAGGGLQQTTQSIGNPLTNQFNTSSSTSETNNNYNPFLI